MKRLVMAMTVAATSLTLATAGAQEAPKAPAAPSAPSAPTALEAPKAAAPRAPAPGEDALKTAPKADDRAGAAPKPEDALKALPKPEEGHALGVRPAKPLTLAPESSSSGVGWKLAFAAGAVGLGVWGMRKRNAQKRNAPKHAIDIVSRKALGVRSELLVVTIDDQTFLLGVTPTSIGMLTTLTDPAGAEETESRPEAREEEEPAPRAANASGALQSIATLFANRAALLPAKAEAPSEPPKSKPRTRRAATAPQSASHTPTTSTSRRTLSDETEKLSESSEGQLRGLLKKRSGVQ